MVWVPQLFISTSNGWKVVITSKNHNPFLIPNNL